MCGIVGVVRRSSARFFARDDVRRMADTIVHRGPDDAGFFDDGRAILGMRRLSIIDLAGGHQPIANEDASLQVVCNGEIYGFQRMRAELERRGHRFSTHSDVEVILHFYEDHELGFVGHLAGMYGLALWDSRRKRLVLARDRLGQKPLYYYAGDGFLAFASEVKALLALPGIAAGVDREALAEYLRLGYCVAPRTIFAGIRKVPPASMLIWEDGEWRTQRYWSLPTVVDAGRTPADWASDVRRELSRAVEEHMVSDVPIGAFLSGGLDSSGIVGLMSQHSSMPVNTYSIGYSGDSTAAYYNELSYAAQVAGLYGTNHHEILVAPDVAELLPTLTWHVEEPISDSAMITTYLVSQLAAKSVKVILSGVGGDELFAGYRRYLGDHYTRHVQRLPRWLRRNVLRPVADALPSARNNRVLDLARYARRVLQASDLDWGARYALYLEICARDTVGKLLGGRTLAEDGFDLAIRGEHSADELLRLFRIDADTQLAEDLLLLTDKTTMAMSIECRAPFLDHKLAELAARIPSEIKVPNGRLKDVMKAALRDVLPAEILDRSKRGFGAPVGAWFKSQLRPLRGALLNRDVVESRGLLQWPAVERVLAAHDTAREDYSDLILVLMNLEIWSRIFIDGQTQDGLRDQLEAAARAA